mgnify:CR=1 FL=1
MTTSLAVGEQTCEINGGNVVYEILGDEGEFIALTPGGRFSKDIPGLRPLAEVHRNQLPSNFADLNSTGSAAYPAGASTAAGFLSHFVENYHQGWLHIDCSATYRKSAVEQWSAGATGLGVRTIANLLTAE